MNYEDLRDLKDVIGTVTIMTIGCQSDDVLRLLAGRLDALADNIRSEQQRRAVITRKGQD
jgi:hypothetical protein